MLTDGNQVAVDGDSEPGDVVDGLEGGLNIAVFVDGSSELHLTCFLTVELHTLVIPVGKHAHEFLKWAVGKGESACVPRHIGSDVDG